MEFTFRWYGDKDPIPLNYIKQIPRVTGIVSALYDIPIGEIWSLEKLTLLQNKIKAVGLNFSVIESIPVHEDIKLGRPNRDTLIENYCQSVRNMGSLGIKILTYNFMPVFDWTRSDLAMEHSDGSNSLSYDHDQLKKIDLREESLDLPGWATNYTKQQLKSLLDAYSEVDDKQLWANLEYFLKKVVPVAEESGVKMGIHPDDPPWSIFGLPRIIVDEAALDRFVKIVDSPSNGITFCVGSFGPNSKMDLVKSIRKYGAMGRIPFLHLRNIKRTGEYSFHEVEHPTEFGDVNMYEVMKTLVEIGFDGAIRPDHGRMIWGEKGRPGYGLYDRALGVMYLTGLWEGIQKSIQSK
ncbi:MAG: mannonate dehydratase [Candidatus Hermodarchaeota archaeon]